VSKFTSIEVPEGVAARFLGALSLFIEGQDSVIACAVPTGEANVVNMTLRKTAMMARTWLFMNLSDLWFLEISTANLSYILRTYL
jgi:hypothetical protein